ncbi:MAG: ATP-dependent Clp protease ATP-binding subunit [Alphaproteobacteria bacterium]|nr:ATP-dependent Clp protease ATP-binding subunit [Alphaproteobacteria bacterium]
MKNLSFNALVERAMREPGMNLVRRGNDEAVLQAASGVRVRLAPRDGGAGVSVTVKMEMESVASLLILAMPGMGAGIEVSGETVFLSFPINDEYVFQLLLDRLGAITNPSAVSSIVDTFPELLAPMTRPAKWLPAEAREDDARRLEVLLKIFRAVEIHGGAAEIRVLLTVFPMGQVILELNAVKLATEFTGVLQRLPAMAGLRSCLILIDTVTLTDQQIVDMSSVLGRLNLADGSAGARFVVFGQKGMPAESPLPRLTLPSFGGAVEPLLDAAGVAPLRRNLLAAAGLEADGVGRDEIIRHFRTERTRAKASKGAYATSRHDRRIVADGDALARIARWRPEARRILDERIVGLDPIKDEILELVEGWFAFASAPLTVLFCGPSGVGKNLLAETLAEVLSPLFELAPPHYLAVNTSMMISETSLWQLIGVQKGLVGAEAPGILATIRDGSVISFDEIDKGSKTTVVQSFLMSLLDDGYRNGAGEFVAVPRCVIVLTANAGAEPGREFTPRSARLTLAGDGKREREAAIAHYREAVARLLLAPLRGRLHREFYFTPPTTAEQVETARREIVRLVEDMRELGLEVDIDTTAESLAVMRRADPGFGLRGIAREVELLRPRLLASAWARTRETPFHDTSNPKKESES